MWIGTLVGVVIGGMGQLGDLCESFIKRQAGQKDSGNIIPGHGGMLDRIDALLFAFPTALLLASSLEWLGIY
jgi:phosphatidate cytidylyltransferase